MKNCTYFSFQKYPFAVQYKFNGSFLNQLKGDNFTSGSLHVVKVLVQINFYSAYFFAKDIYHIGLVLACAWLEW